MPPKRKDNEAGPTGRELKKQKIAMSRTIHVQSKTSEVDPAAGSSKSVKFNSMKGLPSSIDVEKFIEARAFEINAMQESMQATSSNAGKRAWQSLPRHLRRRAASHDPRRVPVRLREKARAEMDTARRKVGRSKPKRGKLNQPLRTATLLKRQRKHTWLETHIWHAKRMHMATKWGYRLALQPTEKSFRPSHRASVHGSILHDASYFGFIELKGAEKNLKATLNLCCDPQGPGPGSVRFLSGSRVLETHLYAPECFPFDLIASISIIWMPLQPDIPPTEDPQTSSGKSKTNEKGKGKEAKEGVQEPSGILPATEVSRTVWIRVHPAAFSEVFATLQKAASLTLDAISRNSKENTPSEDIELADLRGQLNVFEIMGPKANQVLKGALSPIGNDKREDFKKFWQSLGDLQTSSSVPRGMVVGLKVHDPRLKFPPSNAKIQVQAGGTVPVVFNVTPTPLLAASEIWQEDFREKLQKPRYKKKDLDERRSKLLVPGTQLSPLRQDDRIPIILIQRSLEQSPVSIKTNVAGLHGWTLILPAGWSMPFLCSLTYTGTRVGGQRERQTQAYESGIAYFPQDYPFTPAYQGYAQEFESNEKSRWERKPKGKRANWKKLRTRSPWRADWELVLEPNTSSNYGWEDLVPTQREEPLADAHGNPDSRQTSRRHWLLCGSEAASTLNSCCKLFYPPAGLVSEINRLRLSRNQKPLPSTQSAEALWEDALVRVRLVMFSRGTPRELAMICSLDDEEVREYSRAAADDMAQEKENSEVSTSPIIGYVTTGGFSLTRGEGFCIGAIAVSRYFELKQQAKRLESPTLLVTVRNRTGNTYRLAILDLLEK